MSLSHNVCPAWTGEYELLKKFVSEDLKLTGVWRNISISWRKSKCLLFIDGPEACHITQLIICSKIMGSLRAVKTANDTNNITNISDFDVCRDIKDLKFLSRVKVLVMLASVIRNC